ncbi:hypothetical protein ABLE68_15665 [Nocardioides sp. CN2-186]|uniref:hypothetical protein n=1 Tax=Nocardioides tweenelious TaxID=3156607 RepID=UPI0032B5F42F
MTGAARPAGTWVRDLSRADRFLLVLVGAHVAITVAVFLQISHGPLVGDETAYVNGGKALSNLVRDWGSLRAPDGAEVAQNVVGSGWFMPGMSVLLTPLYLVAPHADGAVLRGYIGVTTTLVFLLTVLRVRRSWGALYAGALLVVPGLVPVWAAFSLAAWGDLLAGILIVLLLVELVELSRSLRSGQAPSLGDGVRLGLLAIAVVYLRSSTSLLVAGLGLVSVVAALALLRGVERRRAALSATVAALAFVALLLPWSVGASMTLDGRVVTTTSVPTVLANTFGDRDQVCFGPCDPGSTTWFSPLRYSRETARVTGHSEMDVAEQMSAYARQGVTSRSYSHDVLVDLRSYVREPERFYGYLRADPDQDRAQDVVIERSTRVLVWAAFAVGVGLLICVVRRPREDQVISILLKLSLGALLTQPFVHIAGPRYWTTAAPVLGLAAALLIRQAALRFAPGLTGPGSQDAITGAEIALGRWLTLFQALLSAGVILVATVVVVLATTP